MNSTVACASLTICAISGGASRQLTSTRTALIFAAPNSTSK